MTEENAFEQNVFVLNCVWELFVLVGSEARGKRQDIRIALAAATVYSHSSSGLRDTE